VSIRSKIRRPGAWTGVRGAVPAARWKRRWAISAAALHDAKWAGPARGEAVACPHCNRNAQTGITLAHGTANTAHFRLRAGKSPCSCAACQEKLPQTDPDPNAAVPQGGREEIPQRDLCMQSASLVAASPAPGNGYSVLQVQPNVMAEQLPSVSAPSRSIFTRKSSVAARLGRPGRLSRKKPRRSHQSWVPSESGADCQRGNVA
jgi:hypothetical protein